METSLPADIRQFLHSDVLERFLRYVKVFTTSDPASSTKPSSKRQFDLLRILEKEMRELGLSAVELSPEGFLYATLPPSAGVESSTFGLLAHVDTSADQSGENVKPQCHLHWDGSPITFPDDPSLILSTADSKELSDFIGDTIITASGCTLLGADDKAGVAEIMTALSAFVRFPNLRHGQIQVCFTTDEEVGKGTAGINLDKLPLYCYTMDGGYPGELEDECFDAWRVDVSIQGIAVHPGYAHGKMKNAIKIASEFIAELPETEAPESTESREGFIHPVHVSGAAETAEIQFILRDFEEKNNLLRIERLKRIASNLKARHHGINIELTATHQYFNMKEILREHEHVVALAEKAIQMAGVAVIKKAIRGGTDGSLLCRLGHPTPNIFAGGLLFHSRKEWIAHSALAKAAETIVHLGKLWSEVNP